MKAALPLLIILVTCACREETITRVRVAKEGAPELPPAAAPADGPRWTTPKGWTAAAASGMRLATLTPPGPGKAELTVIALPGESGGDLANANRWRGQIGLGPLDAAGLAAARKSLSSKAGRVDLYDFASSDGKTRLAAGVLNRRGTSWFFKLMGEAPAVERAMPAFRAFLQGLK